MLGGLILTCFIGNLTYIWKRSAYNPLMKAGLSLGSLIVFLIVWTGAREAVSSVVHYFISPSASVEAYSTEQVNDTSAGPELPKPNLFDSYIAYAKSQPKSKYSRLPVREHLSTYEVFEWIDSTGHHSVYRETIDATGVMLSRGWCDANDQTHIAFCKNYDTHETFTGRF